MQLPVELLDSLNDVAGFERRSFEAIHNSGEQITSIRINPAKTNPQSAIRNSQFAKVPWCPEGFYLPERPYFTHDPLLHAGVYYVQEASSMFLSFVMKSIRQQLPASIRVLDLCAAPGGKSTLLLNEIGENGLLVSNEVIKARANILDENITKWGLPNVIVTNNDPAHFASLDGFFDVMLIDAPCSGSGLFRKDNDAISEWSLQNVELCSQRQQRIIADAWDCLKKDGFLIYSTCSYSKEEDEEILDWIGDQFQISDFRLPIDKSWGIVETVSPKNKINGYRFYPDKVKGEGLFIACLQKKDGSAEHHSKAKRSPFSKISKAENEMLAKWISNEDGKLVALRHTEKIFAFSTLFEEELVTIAGNLYIKKAGVRLGELTVKELIPEHDLAVSIITNKQLPKVALSKEEAIIYLKKEEMRIDVPVKGWNLVQYNGHSLGWIKALPNRINNYYPKEWRILK